MNIKKKFLILTSFFSHVDLSYANKLTDKQLARDSITRARVSRKQAREDAEDEYLGCS
jgi:hypothetical protein